MSEAARYRAEVARIYKILAGVSDPLTCDRLTVLAKQYLAKARALESHPSDSETAPQ